jgi:hypothetical protein
MIEPLYKIGEKVWTYNWDHNKSRYFSFSFEILQINITYGKTFKTITYADSNYMHIVENCLFKTKEEAELKCNQLNCARLIISFG